MKYIVLVAICAVSVLSSCNLKPITYEVNMASDTLTIDNNIATKNKDYEGIISLVNPDEDYRLPTLITITISNQTLKDEDYTYDCNSGYLKINANVITDVITISAERVGLESYSATFIGDEHIKFYFYKTRDYSVDPIEGTLAKSRDKDTGLLLKDGTGEINFKVEIDENYDIDMLWVRGLYDKCQDSEKTEKDDVYRITKIRSDLQVTVTTKKIYCKKLAASDDLDNNSFLFSWETREPENVDYINIDATADDYTGHFEVNTESFAFVNATPNKMYNFEFTPVLKNGTVGSTISKTRFIGQKTDVSGLPRVEIETEDNIIPEVKWPVANYVQNIIKIYDTNDSLIYDSSKDLKESKKYEGSKVKVRGNATAGYRKKPYKIKLKEDADLLANFRIADPTIDYTNKDWLLLAPNINNSWTQTTEESEILYTPIGFTVANALNFDWKPTYQFVTLYLNNDYQGIYILCEPTSKGNGSGETQSRYKIDDDGYIVEKDYYWRYEDLIIETPISADNESQFTFKYPDTDDINYESESYIYIKNYLINLENKILNEDVSCFDLIDRESLARWLLGQDIIANEDWRGSNIFLYKKDSSANTKIHMGTIWDYGQSMKNPNSLALIRAAPNFYYKYILELDNFKQDVRTLWEDTKTSVLNAISACLSSFDTSLYDKLLQVESKRWEFTYISTENQIDTMSGFFATHATYLDNNL